MGSAIPSLLSCGNGRLHASGVRLCRGWDHAPLDVRVQILHSPHLLGIGFCRGCELEGGGVGHGFGHSSSPILGGRMANSMSPGLGFAVAGISAPSCHAENSHHLTS